MAMTLELVPPRDPRTVGWFTAGDWTTYFYIIAVYIGTVKVVLPQYMINRKEFKLLGIIRLYNLLLVIANAYFCYSIGIRSYFGGRYSWFCEGLHVQSGDISVVSLHYYYMFIRIIEFLDTVFFVLRKKFNQASVLNISHHCIAVLLPWYGVAYGLDGQICLMAMLNMAVHVVMYSYYFLASFPAIRPQLRWKRYLTMLQIAQFVIIIVHMSIPLCHDCGYPPQSSLLVISTYIYFFLMFTNFYGSAYQTGLSSISSIPSEKGSAGVCPGGRYTKID